MAFPRPSGPSSLWRDLKALAPRERHQQVFMALSLFITTMIFGIFALDFRQAHVVAALADPDPRTAGRGLDQLRGAGPAVAEGPGAAEAAVAAEGFLTRQRLGRPHVTLKLATSLDGRIALRSGESRWITGPEARA